MESERQTNLTVLKKIIFEIPAETIKENSNNNVQSTGIRKILDKTNYKKYLKNLKRFLTNCDVR